MTRRRPPVVAAGLLALGVACARRAPAPPAPPGPVLTVAELLSLPHGPPDHRLAYGADSSQYGELRLPRGPGPHPVVVLFHGGCWREFSSAASIAPMADALRAEGIATWSVEYRRLHQPGGGWPGTYLDAGRAVDHLRALAAPYALDLSRVVVVGHSAGAHLAMWVAARPRLPATSVLHRPDPLPIRGVVNLSGTPDLMADLPGLPAACGEDVVRAMMGGSPQAVPDRYAQASAITMLPLGVPQALVWGARDDQVPLAVAERYAGAARRAGDRVRLVVDRAAGHFETASPRAAVWSAVRSAVRALLDGTPLDGTPLDGTLSR